MVTVDWFKLRIKTCGSSMTSAPVVVSGFLMEHESTTI
jgi:hypothetical protein